MAAIGTALSVAQTLFAALESPLLKKICSILGYKSELKNLKNTVTTVRAVLLDAEARHDDELSNAACDWIEKLKYAVYDADDLLDEFTALAEQKQLLEGGTISKEEFHIRCNSHGLPQRCRSPDGPDWPKIQHIPHNYIRQWDIPEGLFKYE